MATKHCYKGYINNGEVGLGGAVIRPNFRKRGEYEVGDAVLWDSEWKMFRVVPQEDITKITDTTRFTPTGVIAIPSSHDVYGTKEAGVVALLSASLITPDTGMISNINIYWGGYGTDYSELNNYNQANTITFDGTNTVIGFANYPCLPSDAFSGELSLDGITKYSSSDLSAPSPYNADGSRNECYFATGEITTPGFTGSGSKYNALSDFAGKSNTELLCSNATAQENWKTAAITNQPDTGYHPAACACWRFHTTGTAQGDWYLPACGELGYACVRRKKINETIAALHAHFGITLCQLDTYYCLSSSEYSSSGGRKVYFGSGRLNGANSSSESGHVHPFTRLK